MSAEGVRVGERSLLRWLLLVTAALAAAHVLFMALGLWLDPRLLGLFRSFDLAGEGNVPKFVMSLLFAASAPLCWILARRTGSKVWLLLGIAFLGLGLDESAQLHESVAAALLSDEQVRSFQRSGAVPALILVLVFASLFLREWLRMPRRQQLLFALSAALFLFGALGVPWIDRQFVAPRHLEGWFPVFSLRLLEGGAELLGLDLLCCALLSLIGHHGGETVRLAHAEDEG